MNEDTLKQKLNARIKREAFPRFWHYCPTDKFRAGIPDYIFCASGSFGWIELKFGKGKTSRIQEWTHSKIKEANGKGIVCTTVEEAVNFIWSFYNAI